MIFNLGFHVTFLMLIKKKKKIKANFEVSLPPTLSIYSV